MADYLNTVNTFNQRELTFSKDVFDAFAGVSAVMGQQFRGGFHFGLPQLFFDAVLLWQPGEDGPIKRRVLETTGDIYATCLVGLGLAGKGPSIGIWLMTALYTYSRAAKALVQT